LEGIFYHRSIKEALLNSIIVFSAILVFITELLSFFSVLNTLALALAWGCVLAIIFLYLYNKTKQNPILELSWLTKLKNYIYTFRTYEKYLIAAVSFILILVMIQGIVYSPNNWDSMTYHLARIPNWISRQSIAQYPTHILRQSFQPPFSSYVILHCNMLTGSDYFSNSIQFFFLLFSLLPIILICELFAVPRQLKLFAIILTITIPEVILQASSTQNDIVHSFFIISTIFYTLKSLKRVELMNYVFIGIASGLSVLTKSTAYIFLAPIFLILIYLAFAKIIQNRKLRFFGCSLLTFIMFLCINIGQYTRNYKVSGNFLGLDTNLSERYSNTTMSMKVLVSNLVKNVGLHIGPYPLSVLGKKSVESFHKITGIELNDPKTNYLNIAYKCPGFPNHEDSAPNLIQIILIFWAIVLFAFKLIKNKHERLHPNALYFTVLVMQCLLFSIYLKWQPWNTRLHTPLFLLFIPFICSVASWNKIYLSMLSKLMIPCLLYAMFLVCFNKSRPIITMTPLTSSISLFDCRFKKYFSNRLEIYQDYKAVIEKIEQQNFKNIGLLIEGNDWEYPLFGQFYGKGMNPIHINVSNYTKDIPTISKSVECIISTLPQQEFIMYQGKKYRNLTKTNTVIWFYQQ
jgi:hypothetical protein